MMYELKCEYDKANSFYNKAQIKEYKETQDNIIYTIYELYSYKTLVARITRNEETCISTYEYLGHHSATTTRHQKEFFKQFGLNDKEIKEVIRKGVI